MRRIIPVLVAVLLLAGVGAYAVADVRGLVPGVLTRPDPIPPGLSSAPVPATPTQDAPGPEVDPAALDAALAPVLASAALGRNLGAIVSDPISQQTLFSRGADEPRVLASLQKVLSSVPLAEWLDLDATMQTKVVAGASPDDIVLVAGGDTLLGKGTGDPTAVVGRAGLADLAAQVNAKAPAGALTLHLDTTYAAGPRVLDTWDPADVALGFTRGVAQIGLADLRPVHGRVPQTETDLDVVTALAEALRALGRTVEVPEAAALAPASPVGAAAKVLGSVSSAPYLEIITQALAESDNALLENLVRQAIVVSAQAVPADGATGPFVLESLQRRAIDITGVTITDASGLSPRQKAPVGVVAAVLSRATTQEDPNLARIIAGLPVAGLTGTLEERFESADSHPAAGIPRAKTGSLTGVSALAGTTIDAEGRLLTFVVVTNSVPATGQGTKEARAALDRFAAVLTACGCR